MTTLASHALLAKASITAGAVPLWAAPTSTDTTSTPGSGLLTLVVAVLLLGWALRLLRRMYVPIIAELLRMAAQGVFAGLLMIAAIALLLISLVLR